jgi:hypothetical protein
VRRAVFVSYEVGQIIHTIEIQTPLAPVVHPKMNLGKEFPFVTSCRCDPSAFI